MTDSDLLAAIKYDKIQIIEDKPYVKAQYIRLNRKMDGVFGIEIVNEAGKVLWEVKTIVIRDGDTINVGSDFYMRVTY